jgi:hypothetical protein
MLIARCQVRWCTESSDPRADGLSQRYSRIFDPAVTENGVPPKWRHTRSVGQRVAGRTPGWSGPSCVNNKQASYRYEQLTTMDITAEYMEHPKIPTCRSAHPSTRHLFLLILRPTATTRIVPSYRHVSQQSFPYQKQQKQGRSRSLLPMGFIVGGSSAALEHASTLC